MAVRKAKSAAKSVKKKAKGVAKVRRKPKAASPRSDTYVPDPDRTRMIAQLCLALFSDLPKPPRNLTTFEVHEANDDDSLPRFVRLHRLVKLVANDPTSRDTNFEKAKALLAGLVDQYELRIEEFDALDALMLGKGLRVLAPYWFTWIPKPGSEFNKIW